MRLWQIMREEDNHKSNENVANNGGEDNHESNEIVANYEGRR